MTTLQQGVNPRIVVTGEANGPMEIGVRMAVLVDSSRQMNLSDVLARTEEWASITRPTPNFGFSRDAYWFRFTLNNAESHAVDRYLELPVPFLDDVRLFHRMGDSTLAEYRLGDELPFAQRAIRHQNFVMPLTLSPGDNHIYLRLASAGTIEASLKLWVPSQFLVASNNDNLAQGAVVGVLLVMVVYNLFIFFSLRDSNFLLHIGFATSYLLFYFTLTGYSYQYLWPEAVRWNSIAISTFIAAAIVFTCWFATNFLRLRTFSPRAFVLLRTMGMAGAILLVATFFLPYSWTIRLGTFLAMPVTVSALVVGYWRWISGADFARFYCLAWTALLIGLIVLNANKLGLIEANVWTNNASQIGVILQVVLLSFTLADRMNHDRIRRIAAQDTALQHERQARESSQALIKAIEESNRKLESRVQARTMDLHQAMGQLQAANDRLKELSTTDALTQVRNRAFFDEAWDAEVRRASRTLTPVTLVLFDIDHFKRVNDTYGHPAGDACLRRVAGVVGSHVGRAGDVLARCGGEEFAVILVDAELEQALQWVEKVRSDVQQQVLEFDGQTIRFTASFGLAHGVPQARTSPQAILAFADKALYRAKHEGRNCVRHETL
ncbi:diguanylate cyclase [Curvibacter sp. APW13]|uniref:sensor domain-containing diguanylate cyclase n=1 Tax=Curvibacter sp. APW13 TaxID=3077236 RepID=UPI0028DEE450|nr:diguanylate cyclase [Curvibacter sp. APW13]MDT8992219.1 diguanylate cyclase [Curvibacter sp. APW13]